MGVNLYYLELIFILVNVFQQQKMMKKNKHTGRDIIFEEKRQKALERKLGCKFIRIKVMQKMVMIQIMRLVMHKHLLMSSKIKKKKKKTRKTNNKRKGNERETSKVIERQK